MRHSNPALRTFPIAQLSSSSHQAWNFALKSRPNCTELMCGHSLPDGLGKLEQKYWGWLHAKAMLTCSATSVCAMNKFLAPEARLRSTCASQTQILSADFDTIERCLMHSARHHHAMQNISTAKKLIRCRRIRCLNGRPGSWGCSWCMLTAELGVTAFQQCQGRSSCNAVPAQKFKITMFDCTSGGHAI